MRNEHAAKKNFENHGKAKAKPKAAKEKIQPFVNTNERDTESSSSVSKPRRRSSSSGHVFQQHAVSGPGGHSPFGKQHSPFGSKGKNPYKPR